MLILQLDRLWQAAEFWRWAPNRYHISDAGVFGAVLENEQLIKEFAKAGPDARTVFLTGSGTASMEAAVINVFTTGTGFW